MIKEFLVKHNIIKGRFYIEGFVYVKDKDGDDVVIMSDTIKWLSPFYLECKYKDKDRLAFQMLNYKYPIYKGYIYLY